MGSKKTLVLSRTVAELDEIQLFYVIRLDSSFSLGINTRASNRASEIRVQLESVNGKMALVSLFPDGNTPDVPFLQ